MTEQKQLDRAAEIFSWNKRLLSALGLWPPKRNTLIFSANFGYFSFLMMLEYLDLVLFIDSLEHVVMNLTENMAFSQMLIRMCVLWSYNDQLGELIDESLKDYNSKNYKTLKETETVIAYNAKSKTFVKILTGYVAVVASSYYFTPLLVILGGSGLPQTVSNNVTEPIYLLPYRFHTFNLVRGIQSYSIVYTFMFPFVFISGFIQCGTDCIMVTLVYHICGQMAALALRINQVTSNPCECTGELRMVILMHVRLLRMGRTVKEIFSTILLAHLIGATSLVCVLGYEILMNLDKGEMTVLVSIVIYQISVLLVLYAHCTVGEGFLTESSNVSEAFYNCKWYDMSTNHAKCVVLCMARSQEPLSLSAGKFGTFCLHTLTDTIKTAMAYLSVLRSLL